MQEHHGKIWWVEHNSSDPSTASAHFAKLCGWTVDHTPMPHMDYYVASRDGAPVAGIMNVADIPGDRDIPPHWFSYIAVADVDAACTENEKAGGKNMRDPFDVPGVGRIAIMCDPTGAIVGMMTPAIGG